MIVLWVILKNLGFFFVLKVANKVIDTEFLAPFLVVEEPMDDILGARTVKEESAKCTFVCSAQH